MAGKKRAAKEKKEAVPLAVGVRVSCNKVLFVPTLDMERTGVGQMMTKQEGVVIGYDQKTKKWIVEFPKLLVNATQEFNKRDLSVLNFVERKVHPNTTNDVHLATTTKISTRTTTSKNRRSRRS